MSIPTDMAERHARVLGEVAEICLVAAREMQARLLAAEEAAEAVQVAGALHKLTRSVRQSVALEAKLVHDAAREARAAEAAGQAAAEVERAERTERRKQLLNMAVERAIWREFEDLEAERLLDVMDDAIGQLALFDDFLDRDPNQQIVDLCRDLGVWDGQGPLPPHLAERAERVARDHARQKRSGLNDESWILNYGVWGSERGPGWRSDSS